MCLILLSWQHPSHTLLMAANRDEFYQRPSQTAGFWKDHPQILAGKDLKEGGTWLGITKSGRFAAITNYRAPDKRTYSKSRGQLTKDFLSGRQSPKEYAKTIALDSEQYAGFNLLIGSTTQLVYCSNRHPDFFWRPLSPGLYGLSNHLLDTEWPKVITGKQGMNNVINNKQEAGNLFELLKNNQQAKSENLPNTGVGQLLEELLSPIFISSPNYGTRTSTVLKIDKDKQVLLEEQNYLPGEKYGDQKCFVFSLT